MRVLCVPAIAAIAMMLAAGCASEEPAGATNVDETAHMVAQAKLTAHYIAAALEAVKSADEINATLMSIADTSMIAEFWVSDETGRVVFTTDPNAGTQAAPFADLLMGNKQVVTQGIQPREADGKLFQYVGAAGVNQPRIVQVGIAGPAE